MDSFNCFGFGIVDIVCFYQAVDPLSHEQGVSHNVRTVDDEALVQTLELALSTEDKDNLQELAIKYNEYSKGHVYLKYAALASPMAKADHGIFGKSMLNDFTMVLDTDKPDAAFFKFCFVDFMVKAESSDERFNQLIRTIQDVYKETNRRNISLIIGNALPLTGANDETVDLQNKFNRWLMDFSSSKKDVAVFDMFSPIAGEKGRLEPDYERGGGDPHLNDRAFSELDKALFRQLENFLVKK